MRVFFFVFFSVFIQLQSFSQKPSIDTNSLKTWPDVGSGQLSVDGRFASYIIWNQPTNSRTVILIATDGLWKLEFPDAVSAKFSANGKLAVVAYSQDSLSIIALGGAPLESLSNISSYEYYSFGAENFLLYRQREKENDLTIYNLNSKDQNVFTSVTRYLLLPRDNQEVIILQNDSSGDRSFPFVIKRVLLRDMSSKTIYLGSKPENFVFDETGKKMAFLTQRASGIADDHVIWYYKMSLDSAYVLADGRFIIRSSSWRLKDLLSFAGEGKTLLFTACDSLKNAKPTGVQVDVWNYKDEIIQSRQLLERQVRNELKYTHIARYAIDLSNRTLIQLESEREFRSPGSKDLVLINHQNSDHDPADALWNANVTHRIYLQSDLDGQRIALPIPKYVNFSDCLLSPMSKYVIYYDSQKKNYFAYSVAEKTVKNITKYVPANWNIYDHFIPSIAAVPCGIAGWLEDDSAVLVYDRNDIWQLDTKGVHRPICLTNRYGSRKNIIFRLESNQHPTFQTEDSILLNVFNNCNKQNGFARIKIGQRKDPLILFMGDVVCNGIIPRGTQPIKAERAECYLMLMMSATESPNYFFTRDFRSFTQLSHIWPEKEFNWVHSELFQWKTFAGQYRQGILYKPDNFDKSKKYPIIFYYYQKLSDDLNTYLRPELSIGAINIPWFVSRDYLVFCPDIQNGPEGPGYSAFNSVVSAALSLSRFPWIDKKRMGIHGHSFGGYETNFLVTHTGIFAAAMSGAGVSDIISQYGSVGKGDINNQFYYEAGQGQMGANLWGKPKLYISNSPIYNANKVVTPILLMNNKKDNRVDFEQGVEFFTALRRLNKKAWMLQYDEGDHVLNKYEDCIDFTIRLTQFFDHYLKNKPMPKWMSDGIPAANKGVDTGYEGGSTL